MLIGGVAAVIRHHLVVMRLVGNFVAVRWHHLAVMRLDGGYAAVNWVASFLPRIFTELGTDFHIVVFICALFVFICVFYYRAGSKGIQPKRLNAEG